jgi:hypothetical protein
MNMESTIPRSDNERKDLLQNYIVKMAAQGWRTEAQSEFSATISLGIKTAHVLHFILSVISFGFWLFIWIILVLSRLNKRRRQFLKIDKFGNIRVEDSY